MFLQARALGCVVGSLGILWTSVALEASVVSLKAVKKNDVAIAPTNNLAVAAGDKIETEIFLSGWANELPLGVLAFQVMLDATGYTSGTNGKVLPDGWCAPVGKIECTQSSTCPTAYPICITAPLAYGCTCAGFNPNLGAFITTSRADFIFSTIDGLVGVGLSSLYYRYFGVVTAEGSVPDASVPRYVGTLVLRVSANACGTFGIGFQGGNQTFITDPLGNPVFPTPQPLVLTVTDCCRIEVQCNPAHCNIDARIAHPPDTPLPRLTTNTLVMSFCDSAIGMTPEDFEVTIVPLGPGDVVPSVATVTPAGNSATIVLNHRIAPELWTCVRHIESDRRCCIGSLPGDVDNNRSTELEDGFELFDNLNAHVNPPLAIEKCDIDRSLLCTPADLLMLIDLLNDPFPCDFGVCGTLPVCPSFVPPP